MNPCTCAAGALRGAPASTTATRRRPRLSTRAAERPAAPPPITTTSCSSIPRESPFPRAAATLVDDPGETARRAGGRVLPYARERRVRPQGGNADGRPAGRDEAPAAAA